MEVFEARNILANAGLFRYTQGAVRILDQFLVVTCFWKSSDRIPPRTAASVGAACCTCARALALPCPSSPASTDCCASQTACGGPGRQRAVDPQGRRIAGRRAGSTMGQDQCLQLHEPVLRRATGRPHPGAAHFGAAHARLPRDPLSRTFAASATCETTFAPSYHFVADARQPAA